MIVVPLQGTVSWRFSLPRLKPGDRMPPMPGAL